MPEIATQPGITVYSTEGKDETILHNPVYSFQPKDANGKNIAFGQVPSSLSLQVVGIISLKALEPANTYTAWQQDRDSSRFT